MNTKVGLIAFIFFFTTLVVSAQEFKTHKVQDGESIESIASKYLVTPFDIYALNPDAKSKFAPNMVLIIPDSKVKNDSNPLETKEVIGYKNHKVRRKETLFSISQKYKVEVDEIKKYNTFLYANNLRKGDKLRIPRFKTIVNKVSLKNTLKEYEVQPKEGKWRVAYKFGITVSELEALNPTMNEVLQPGDKLFVPNIADNEEKVTDENYNYYEVQPKEGFYRLKVKLGLTQEQLEMLNPELKEGGLKAGMVLKIPSDLETGFEVNSDNVEHTNLASSITNYNEKRIALLLPFQLHKVDVDTVAETKEMIRKDRLLGMTLDYHSGVLMALDSAKQLGISTRLKVFDTENRPSVVSNIVNDNDFSDYDAVIGPLMPANFDRMAQAMKRDKIPTISPLALPKKVYENVFQTVPSKDMLKDKIVNYVKSDSTVVNVIVIADHKHKTISNDLKSQFSNVKQVFSRKNKEGEDRYYILLADIENLFIKGKNVVFLESENEGFVSNVTSMLNGLDFQEFTFSKPEIVLMTTDKNRAFDGESIQNSHLSSLQFHYPSANKVFDDSKSGFVKAYKAKYGITPNKYAVRGFDLTLDVLLRLATKDNLYEASNNDLETEYIENKFRYNKKLFGGYYNEAAYIVKHKDLQIVEAE